MFGITRDRHNPAQRRYLRRFMPAMLAYVIVLALSTRAIAAWSPTGVTLFLLSLLPSLPLVAAIGIMAVYLMEERDEFIRMRLISAMLGGLAIVLAVTTVWGFLENGGAVPHFPTFLTFPIWCGCFGLWQCLANLRDRRAA